MDQNPVIFLTSNHAVVGVIWEAGRVPLMAGHITSTAARQGLKMGFRGVWIVPTTPKQDKADKR